MNSAEMIKLEVSYLYASLFTLSTQAMKTNIFSPSPNPRPPPYQFISQRLSEDVEVVSSCTDSRCSDLLNARGLRAVLMVKN